jgi:flagellar biosynthesis/type III secretory pathway M-ring protein FliF/YscJ
MIPAEKVILIALCLGGILFAQVDEVPSLRSTQESAPAVDEERASEVADSKEDSNTSGKEPLSREETEQIRSFVTINSMIVIILVLIVALVFFVIVRRVRRSKKQ